MLLAHIVDFHAGKRPHAESLLNCESGIIGVDVHLHHIFRGNADNRIADGFQKRLKSLFLVIGERIFQIDNELRTITETNLGRIQMGGVDRMRLSALACLCDIEILKKHFSDFSAQCLKRTVHDCHETLTAGVHNTRLF